MKNKFALLSYQFDFKNAFNVGDYIQSLAARQFFPVDDDDIILINREKLNTKKENINALLIMNGWFSHYPDCWPPADYITPIFVSFHINKSVEDFFKKPDVIEYLKKHEPIGCRDTHTQEFLRKNGIESYFSGCLTTTFEKVHWTKYPDKENKKVLLIDILHNIGSLNYLFSRTDINFINKLIRIPKTIKARVSIVNAEKLISKIKSSIRLNRNHVVFESLTTQFSAKINEPERFSLAKEYLEKYSNADLVITSRIHVALPCLALGTPFVFVNPEVDTSRFPGLSDFFNLLSKGDICSMSKSELGMYFNNIENKDNFLIYRENLITTCENKVAEFNK